MPCALETDASDHHILVLGVGFPGVLTRSQQRRCYWISNKRTNDRQDYAANAEWPNDVPALLK